jgi:hypothetical protein
LSVGEVKVHFRFSSGWVQGIGSAFILAFLRCDGRRDISLQGESLGEYIRLGRRHG